MIVAGVDEAGRGSVLGPMVVAGVTIKTSELKLLRDLGVKDSKKLTRKKREQLYKKILKMVDDYYVHVVKPSEIDRSVAIQALNSLEAASMAMVIDRLRPSIAYVDSCDVNPARYRRVIASALNCKIRINSRHRAESENLAVAAASIVAKVRRDRAIAKLRKKLGDIGSGYPSDKITMRFINNWIQANKVAPSCARNSWKPIRTLLNGYAKGALHV